MIKMAAKTDSKKMGQPSFMMVLKAGELTKSKLTQVAYRRKDGVWKGNADVVEVLESMK